MEKKIGIMGSTGSIGTQTLEIVRNYPDKLKVVALSANTNVEKIEAQIREFHPEFVCMMSEDAAEELKVRIKDLQVKVTCGMDGLLEMAALPSMDTLVTAVVGMIGIRPTICAIEHHKEIALANKETLVTAGHLIMPLAEKTGVRILPVDSEHSAIFQSLQGEKRSQIRNILLTASGGPFRGKTKEELREMTVEDALKHPNWSMGRKITVDSSTLVNKGLEVMEVKWLFDVPLDHIRVVVQPQSILHSAVEFDDGAVIGQMGVPDMKLPIQYALFYPDRLPMEGNALDLFEVGCMTFEKPDTENFRGLALAFDAARAGGSLPTIFNAANEQAVALFLDHRIRFLQIAELIEDAMKAHHVVENPSLAQILDAEQEAREFVLSRLSSYSKG
ncbi:MAG: 1-deoxy-D-xylulose-5-phosphate reductoisomerase [Lachnospiraceae bacterium]|nr:1-deoxy-D-xylulose-5-phosphate reductoisomerase [Lachnospiraceae bacterium]